MTTVQPGFGPRLGAKYPGEHRWVIHAIFAAPSLRSPQADTVVYLDHESCLRAVVACADCEHTYDQVSAVMCPALLVEARTP